jgi:hypothetical protein
MAGNNRYTRNVTPEERFWKLVDRRGPDECWEWNGVKRSGYGRFVLEWRKGNDRDIISAHRYSYILAHGAIPEGLIICHKCNTRSCVNPNHIYAGTYSDNQQDSIRAGTFPPRYGKYNGISKLTDDLVREAREIYARGGIGFRRLSKRYDVSKAAIRNAVMGKTWRHVE